MGSASVVRALLSRTTGLSTDADPMTRQMVFRNASFQTISEEPSSSSARRLPFADGRSTRPIPPIGRSDRGRPTSVIVSTRSPRPVDERLHARAGHVVHGERHVLRSPLGDDELDPRRRVERVRMVLEKLGAREIDPRRLGIVDRGRDDEPVESRSDGCSPGRSATARGRGCRSRGDRTRRCSGPSCGRSCRCPRRGPRR